jgi:hypothetical protein
MFRFWKKDKKEKIKKNLKKNENIKWKAKMKKEGQIYRASALKKIFTSEQILAFG